MVPYDFYATCINVALAFPVTEFTDKLPHEEVVFEIEPGPNAKRTVFQLGPDTTLGDSVVAISMAKEPDDVMFKAIGHWRKKTGEVGVTKEIESALSRRGVVGQEIADTLEFRTVFSVASVLSTLCELVCEPRLVERSVINRAERRRAQKQYGYSAIPSVWAKCSWTIGGKTKAKGDPNAPGAKKPYHLVRGHWRYYGDRQTAKAETRPGKPGWWVWIESHHSGSPAYGIVKHRYEPKIQDPGKSSRVLNELMQGRTDQWLRRAEEKSTLAP